MNNQVREAVETILIFAEHDLDSKELGELSVALHQLEAFVFSTKQAKELRIAGEIDSALLYEAIADNAYNSLKAKW